MLVIMGLKVILFFYNMCRYESKMRKKFRLSVVIFNKNFCDTENKNEFKFGPQFLEHSNDCTRR
jgi:hypothetical protein